jgi:hypothetical protein
VSTHQIKLHSVAPVDLPKDVSLFPGYELGFVPWPAPNVERQREPGWSYLFVPRMAIPVWDVIVILGTTFPGWVADQAFSEFWVALKRLWKKQELEPVVNFVIKDSAGADRVIISDAALDDLEELQVQLDEFARGGGSQTTVLRLKLSKKSSSRQ